MSHPCLSCGACCAYFRIAFHWSETDPALGGTVPAELTEKLDPHRVVMRGTQSKTPRCVALVGEIGVAAYCGIHPIKPSVCREVEPSWEFGRHSPQCDKGRIAHGLLPLTPADWPIQVTSVPVLPELPLEVPAVAVLAGLDLPPATGGAGMPA